MTIRYVGYPSLQGFAGGYPEFFASISEAKQWLRDHGDKDFAAGADGEGKDSMVLHRVTCDECIEEAKEFAGVGNPFDYPDAVIEFGPRGGIRRVSV